MVCRHQHSGTAPPVRCPVCGVSSEKFEGIIQEDDIESVESRDRIVIVGAGIAGISAAEEIRSISGEAKITLIHKEKTLPYYRLNLTRYLAGEVDESVLQIHPESWYQDRDIHLIVESEVTKINRTDHHIDLSNGQKISYDKLILTAGSHPFQPPVPGALELKGVTTLRTLADAKEIARQIEQINDVVVIGGGVLGLEAAGALTARKKGLNVTIIEGFDYLMPRQLNKKAAAYLKAHLDGLGINVVSGTSVTALSGDEDSQVTQVQLANEQKINAQLVIFSVGVRSETYLARGCGLTVNHGIIVDDTMETSAPGIYAAGDIAEHRGVVYGLWNAAMFEGKIAGMNAAGKKTDFGGIPRSNTLKVLDVDLFSIGNFNASDGSCIPVEDAADDQYSFVLFRDSKIEGAVLLGDTTQSALMKAAIEEKVSIPSSLIWKKELGPIFTYLSEQV